MKRVLVVASVASMIQQFNMPNIKLLLRMGYMVDVACNFEQGSSCTQEKVAELKEVLADLGVRCFQIDFARNVLKVSSNLKSISQVRRLMLENRYAFAHCHSPIGGLVTRIAGRATRTKVIYTAHGFHFYKGAPLLNWLLFYPIEKLCARWTDVLATINTEDYALARSKMKARRVVYLPGVGIDTHKSRVDTAVRTALRSQLGAGDSDILLFSVGELNDNKNHAPVVMEAAKRGLRYVIAGKGANEQTINDLINSNHASDRIKLLGFRNDIQALLDACDIFVFPSFREGLSVALMEAMAAGKPCVVSRIRGNTDLIDEAGGEFFDPADAEDVGRAIDRMLARDMAAAGEYNKKKIEKFSVENVMRLTEDIYRNM